jgi:DNA-binding LacI/PurR family transcriptional regulator
MATTALVPRYRLIADTLRREITTGALAPGARVPSYRTLMDTHSVTMATIRQAISSLQVEGLIESVPGVGCVVAEAEAKWTTIGIPVLGHDATGFLPEELRLLHDELTAQRCDLVVRFVPVVDERSTAELTAWARRRDGVMIAGRIPVRVIGAMVATGVPAVVMGEPLDGECPEEVSLITADVPGRVQMAIGRLAAMGHRRVGLVNGVATRYYDSVSASFQECARAFGPVEGAEWPELRLAQGRSQRVEETYQWYAGLSPRPTALLVEGATVASALIRHFTARGVGVPEDLSVVAIAGGERTPQVLDGLAGVGWDVQTMLRRGVRALSESVGTGRRTVVRERLLGQWIPGVTCRGVSP